MGNGDQAKRVKDLEDLIRVSSVLADETLKLDFRLQETTNAMLKLLGARVGSIMMLEKDELVVLASSNPKIRGFRKNIKDTSIATDVVRTGRMNLMRRTKQVPHDLSNYQSNFSASLPLFANGGVIGVLNVTDKETADDFTSEEIDFLEHFKKWIEIVMENSRLKRRVEELSAKTKAMLDHPAH